jgi:hypothetical protein
MWKPLLVVLCAASCALVEAADEWAPFRKPGLFPADGTLWLAPDMEKDSLAEFTSRLLDGARQGNAKAMATLGRFFFVRGDIERAVEWLGKAAEAGHAGAHYDFGTLYAQGRAVPVDLVEAYKWLWLATWEDAPGADVALRELSGKLAAWQVLVGIRRAAEFQATQAKEGAGLDAAQRVRSNSSK